jgi:hypothetical protein
MVHTTLGTAEKTNVVLHPSNPCSYAAHSLQTYENSLLGFTRVFAYVGTKDPQAMRVLVPLKGVAQQPRAPKIPANSLQTGNRAELGSLNTASTATQSRYYGASGGSNSPRRPHIWPGVRLDENVGGSGRTHFVNLLHPTECGAHIRVHRS